MSFMMRSAPQRYHFSGLLLSYDELIFALRMHVVWLEGVSNGHSELDEHFQLTFSMEEFCLYSKLSPHSASPEAKHYFPSLLVVLCI